MKRPLAAWWEETHGANFELVRHFLARFFDSEMVTTPGEWLRASLGMLVVLPSAWMMMWLLYQVKYLILLRRPYPNLYRMAVREDQLYLIALMMCVTAVLTAIQWQALFPARRDLLALASLPLRPRQIFLAKFGALLLLFAVFVVLLNAPFAMIFAGITGGRWQENPSALVNVAAVGGAWMAGCTFVFFSLVGIQGVLLNVLPARLFTRASVLAQAILFTAAVAALPFLSRVRMGTAWWPPQWFLNLWAAMIGARDGLSHKALLAVGLAAAVAVGSYLLSYRRFRRLLLEAPLERGRRRWSGAGSWMLERWIGDPREQGAFVFIWKTLLRSRSHRLVLLAYGGLALGWLVRGLAQLPQGPQASAAYVRLLVVLGPLTLALFVIAGLRYLFSLPVELGANWVFQTTESGGRAAWLRAVERFVIWCGIVPVFVAAFPASAAVLGLGRGLSTSLLGFLLVLVGMEVLFWSWRKMPFTCSHFPGKRPVVHTLLPYGIVLPWLAPASFLFVRGSRDATVFLAILAVELGAWWTLRRMRRNNWKESVLRYEEGLDPAVTTLDLSFDPTLLAPVRERGLLSS